MREMLGCGAARCGSRPGSRRRAARGRSGARPCARWGWEVVAAAMSEPSLRAVASRGAAAVRKALLGVAVLSFASLGAGCWRPLAHQHEFFSPVAGTAARIAAETQHVVSHYRARPQACPSVPVPGSVTVPDPSCETPPERPDVAAHGGASNAYGRWVSDRPRPLPGGSDGS